MIMQTSGALVSREGFAFSLRCYARLHAEPSLPMTPRLLFESRISKVVTISVKHAFGSIVVAGIF
jgi:hypothetical protein